MCAGRSEKMTDEQILESIRNHDDKAVTAVELSDELELTSTRICQRLNKLNELDKVRKKKVGGRAVVWWLQDD